MRHDPFRDPPGPTRPAARTDPPQSGRDALDAWSLLSGIVPDAVPSLPSLEALADWAAADPCDRDWSEGALCRRAAAELWRDGYEGRSALRSLLALSIGEERAGRVLAAFERRVPGRGRGG